VRATHCYNSSKAEAEYSPQIEVEMMRFHYMDIEGLRHWEVVGAVDCSAERRDGVVETPVWVNMSWIVTGTVRQDVVERLRVSRYSMATWNTVGDQDYANANESHHGFCCHYSGVFDNARPHQSYNCGSDETFLWSFSFSSVDKTLATIHNKFLHRLYLRSCHHAKRSDQAHQHLMTHFLAGRIRSIRIYDPHPEKISSTHQRVFHRRAQLRTVAV
jgi:hypothetical protein